MTEDRMEHSRLEHVLEKIQQAGIRFLLAQFVDIHGAAKVKMAPACELDSIVNDGAGFAGAAVWITVHRLDNSDGAACSEKYAVTALVK